MDRRWQCEALSKVWVEEFTSVVVLVLRSGSQI